MNDSPNKAAALALASRGLRIFQCSPSKRPIIEAWEDAATNSVFDVAMKWDTTPSALPGLPVGAHGLVVIDADRKPNGPDGVAAFQALCASEEIDLSAAFVVETPSGGLHYYFASPTPYGNSSGSLPDGIDVRGVGGNVIAPGATLPDGRSYRILLGSWDAVPPLPDALARFLREKKAEVPLSLETRSDAPLAGDRERRCASAAIAAEVSKLRSMREGSGRNRALNDAAHSLGTMAGWIDLNEVANALYQASVDNGYVSKDGASAAQQTITSGIEAGRKKPRKMLTEWTDEELAEDKPWIDALIEKARRKDGKPTAHATSKRKLNLVRLNEVEEESIEWLWEGFLPRATYSLIAGAIQAGKSTIAMSFAATVTTGGLWPDGTRCRQAGNVIFWSSEEIVKSVVKPRLIAAGADTSRVLAIESTLNEKGEPCAFDPSTDIPLLRKAILELGGVSLVIIDPIISAVDGDINKANEVRRGLKPVVDLAEEFDCTVLGIGHMAKNSQGKSTNDRVMNSQAFAAMARVVLVAAKKEDSNERVFAISKSNISADHGGFSYSIEGVSFASPKGKQIKTSRIAWGAPVRGSADELLGDAEAVTTTDDDTSKLGQAKAFLLEALAHQAVGSKELFKNAYEGLSISEKTLRRAGDRLGIKPQKHPGYQGGWYWSLPQSVS